MPTLRNPFDLCPRIPENPEKAIENVVAKSKKVKNNQKKDRNWMDMPKEMKEEIVKQMDFLTRIRFAATAKDEKTLAEAEKYRLNSLEIYVDCYKITFRAYNIVGHRLLRKEFVVTKNETGEWKPLEEWYKKAHAEIFKKCEIQSFCHHSFGPLQTLSKKLLQQVAPFTFKRFVCGDDWKLNEYILNNSKNLESISIDAFRLTRGSGRGYDVDQIFSIPSVFNVKHLELVNINDLPKLQKIVQDRFNSDAEIDKSLEVEIEEAGMIDSFAEIFLGNIAEKTDERVRIRMEDQSKQILIQKIDNFNPNPRIANFLIKIIPTGLPESEYKTVPFDKFKYSMPRFKICCTYAAPKLPA